MARILRGDIRQADLNPLGANEARSKRPVLVISHDVFNERSGTAIVLPLTTQRPGAGFPLAVQLLITQATRSWVKIGQVRTISLERLGKKLAQATPEELERIIEGLTEIVG